MQVEHRVALRQLDRRERREEDDGADEAADDQRARPALLVPLQQPVDEQEQDPSAPPSRASPREGAGALRLVNPKQRHDDRRGPDRDVDEEDPPPAGPLREYPAHGGPIATAAPVVAPQIPNAVPRSRPWKAFASSASDTANMTPPPTPCTARAAMSTASFAIPQPKDATVNSTRPIVKTSRRPKRSASDPPRARSSRA